MTAPTGRAAGQLRRLLRGLAALLVLLAVVIGVPLLMAALHLVPHGLPPLHQLGQQLRQRDNGQLAVAVIAAGVWICWALFILSLIPEIIAVARRTPSRPLPWLSGFQRPAGVLVTAVFIGFTAAPLIPGAVGRADAALPPLPGPRPAVTASIAIAGERAQPAGTGTKPPTTDAETVQSEAWSAAGGLAQHSYQVQRRDTLWRLAETYLGDPMRYEEIVRLNPDVIGPDNEITAGTVLRMPSDASGLSRPSATAATAQSVGVEPGDSLWSIEQRVTGSGQNWHSGWEANRGRAEPGGERFEDPNLIKPGWTLTIPTPPAASGHATPTNLPAPNQGHAPGTSSGGQPGGRPGGTITPPPAPATTSSATAPSSSVGRAPNGPGSPAATSAATPSRSTAPVPPSRPDAHHPAAARPNRSYVGFEVGGGLLAATGFTALMAHRRRKFRHRQAGHVVASLPADLLPLEQTLTSEGRAALGTMTFLDLALRDLAERVAADPDGRLPDVVGAALNDDSLELSLSDDISDPPEPWVTSGRRRWALDRTTALDGAAARRVAPYPCLVSVGYSEDGTEYLLDLEHVGALQLVGDPHRCLDLARYIVAELANNVWSDHLTVTVAGFAGELVDANPTRLAHTDDPHAAAAELDRVARGSRAVACDDGVDMLEGRLRGTDADAWMPHIVLAGPGVLDEDADLLRSAVGGGRTAVAVVLSGGHPLGEPACQLEVGADGTLRSPLLPADAVAFGLPIDDAADMARAIALDRDGAIDEPTLRSAGNRPWDAFADAAGALLPECTMPRETNGAPAATDSVSVDRSSVLPGSDEAYLAATATTQEDLAALAPAVSVATRTAVEKSDPQLDELVAGWHDPDAQLARLQVLGPVTVTAYGRPPDKPGAFCTEIVAYLWQHPNGVSTDQFANDLWPHKNYTGTDSQPKDVVSTVRHWLGVDPRTGREYLPRARRGGVQGYRLDGMLVDYDLFRRLRARGQARGADGLPDLMAALNLVSGTPWSKQRPFGYGWLPPGEELLCQGAVAEVAHLVATRALETGDDEQVLKACETALRIDPEDDRALLALVKAHAKAGREAEKEAALLRLAALDDPPARTLEVMRRNGWLRRGA